MLKFITSSRHFVSTLLAAVASWVKANRTAKPFDIYKEQICSKKEADGYWLADDGYIYYGNRWLVFFKSAQNSWWLSRNSR